MRIALTFSLLLAYGSIWAQCTGTNRGAPACSMNNENGMWVLNGANQTITSASCATVTMGAKTNLRIINNSILTIDGNFSLNGEEVCVYIDATSQLIVNGNVTFTKAKITFNVNGTFQANGTFSESGDAAGSNTSPALNGSGIYVAAGGCNLGGTACTAISLPIELLDFTARAENGQVSLNWSTASEQSNEFFTIEKSRDGENYEVLSHLSGAGDSNQKLEYSLQDNSPISGLSYYRLSQTDYDGTHVIVGVEAVRYLFGDSGLKMYPNPASEILNVVFNQNGNNEVVITDLLGSKVQSLQMNGQSKLEVNVSQLRPGVYFLQIHNELGKVSEPSKFIIDNK